MMMFLSFKRWKQTSRILLVWTVLTRCFSADHYTTTHALLSSSRRISSAAASVHSVLLQHSTATNRLDPLHGGWKRRSTYGRPSVTSLLHSARDESRESVVTTSTAGSLRSKLQVDKESPILTRAPWIVGHRGCIYEELENTRPGFRRCVEEWKIDAVELDVFCLNTCGTVVVFHGGGSDENAGSLDDYCGLPGKNIVDLTLAEVQQLSFNVDFAEFPCPRTKIQNGKVPTLEDVLLDAKDTGLQIKIELKGSGVVKPALEVVERLGMMSQCTYSSFDLQQLALLRQLRPDSSLYPTGALFNKLPADYLPQTKTAGATEVHLRYDTCTPTIVQDIHDAGYASMVWFRGAVGMSEDCQTKYLDVGNEDRDMYTALLQTGVQQLCVNRPDVLRDLKLRLA